MTCDATRRLFLITTLGVLTVVAAACSGLPAYEPLRQGAHVDLELTVDLDPLGEAARSSTRSSARPVRLWIPEPLSLGPQLLYDTAVESARSWRRTEDAAGHTMLVFEWPADAPPEGELSVRFSLRRRTLAEDPGRDAVEVSGWLLAADDDEGRVREGSAWREPPLEGVLPSDRVAMNRSQARVLEPPQAGPGLDDWWTPYAEVGESPVDVDWSLEFVRVAYED